MVAADSDITVLWWTYRYQDGRRPNRGSSIVTWVWSCWSLYSSVSWWCSMPRSRFRMKQFRRHHHHHHHLCCRRQRSMTLSYWRSAFTLTISFRIYDGAITGFTADNGSNFVTHDPSGNWPMTHVTLVELLTHLAHDQLTHYQPCVIEYTPIFDPCLLRPNGWMDQDDNLQRLLHQLVSATSHSYTLRKRAHNRQLPDRLSRLVDCNYIIRMLFYQSYWHLSAFVFSFTIDDVNNCVFVCSNVVYILLLCCNCGLPVSNKRICYVMLLVTEVGLAPDHIVLDGVIIPARLSAHVYCGQTVAHLSYCWAVVNRHLRISNNHVNEIFDQQHIYVGVTRHWLLSHWKVNFVT